MRELCMSRIAYLVPPNIVIHRPAVYIINVRAGYLGSVLLCIFPPIWHCWRNMLHIYSPRHKVQLVP